MKKILALVLFAAMMLTLAIPAMAADGDMVTFNAPKFTPVIDGIKDDGYGDGVDVKALVFRTDATSGATGKLWTCWDDKNLYLYMEVYDTTPNHDHPNEWEQDCVDFYIDWNSAKGDDLDNNGNPYWQMTVHSAPADGSDYQIMCEVNGDYGNRFDFAVDIPFVVLPLVGDDFKGGYKFEVACPIALTPEIKPLKEGGSVIFDVQINDNQGEARDTGAWLRTDYDDADMQFDMPGACRGLIMLNGAPSAGTPAPDPVADPPADVPAPVDDAPAPSAPSAPKVGDNAMIFVILAIAMAGAFVVTKRVIRTKA